MLKVSNSFAPRLLHPSRFRCKWLSTSTKYFTKEPLNYETYSFRLQKFERDFKNKKNLKAESSVLIDLIKANRELQLRNSLKHHVSPSDDFLGITKSKPSFKLEKELYHLIFNNALASIDTNVFCAYLFTYPKPYNRVDKLFTIVQRTFLRDLANKGIINHSIVTSLLNFLLENNDYRGGWKLIDITYNHPNTLKFHRRKFFNRVIISLLSILTILSIQWFCVPLIPLYVYLIANTGIASVFGYYMLKINIPNHLGRVSWRSYNSILYNYQHTYELIKMNKILTYFEEHNEINIRNFHTSEVRKMSNLSVFNLNEYIIELPSNTNELMPYSGDGSASNSQEDPETSVLRKDFRFELNKRKMILNDLQEELNFLEFWLTHGENFEWVEPDQDPAEMISFINK